jgi:hypothetical protein
MQKRRALNIYEHNICFLLFLVSTAIEIGWDCFPTRMERKHHYGYSQAYTVQRELNVINKAYDSISPHKVGLRSSCVKECCWKGKYRVFITAVRRRG